jgi:hypothetical protein
MGAEKHELKCSLCVLNHHSVGSPPLGRRIVFADSHLNRAHGGRLNLKDGRTAAAIDTGMGQREQQITRLFDMCRLERLGRFRPFPYELFKPPKQLP